MSMRKYFLYRKFTGNGTCFVRYHVRSAYTKLYMGRKKYRVHTTWRGCQTEDLLGVAIMYSIHYCDVIMGVVASHITSLKIVYSTVYSDADQRKHQSSASLVFVRGIHRGPLNSPHRGPVARIMFPFDDVIMWKLFWSAVIIRVILLFGDTDIKPRLDKIDI